MQQITLYKAGRSWFTLWEDPEVKKLFPPHGVIETGIPSSVDGLEALTRIQELNPEYIVRLLAESI